MFKIKIIHCIQESQSKDFMRALAHKHTRELLVRNGFPFACRRFLYHVMSWNILYNDIFIIPNSSFCIRWDGLV